MSQTEKHPAFQQLMDQAYARWQKAESMTKAEFMAQLQGLEVAAVPLGNFVYQVQNGGLSQWQGNGYSAYRQDVRMALRMVGTPAAQATAAVLAGFEQLCKRLDVDLDDANSYASEYDEEEFQEFENQLSSWFYVVDDQLLDDAEAFFKAAQGS